MPTTCIYTYLHTMPTHNTLHVSQGRPKGDAHGQKTCRFDDVVICRYAIGFIAAELFDGLAGIEIFLGDRDNAHDRRRCRSQHGIIEQYRAGYGIWHFEMTEVEGRIEAIIRASHQLVEIEAVPLQFIVMGDRKSVV